MLFSRDHRKESEKSSFHIKMDYIVSRVTDHESTSSFPDDFVVVVILSLSLSLLV